MKFLAMHITNQKWSFDIFTVGHLLNILMIYGIKENGLFWPIHCIVSYCYKYTSALYMTAFVLQGHVFVYFMKWVVVDVQSQIGCKLLASIMQYTSCSNYFWMLCEGIYLHTLIVVAVFVGEQQLGWYYILGWGLCIWVFMKQHQSISDLLMTSVGCNCNLITFPLKK